MFPNGFTGFDINNPIWPNNTTGYNANFDTNSLNWNVTGPSQPHTGVDVYENLKNHPDFFVPSTTHTSLYPGRGGVSNGGYNAPLYQGSATSSWPQQEAAVHLPLPTYPSVPALPRGREYPPVARQASTAPLSRLASSLHPRRYVAPINRGRHPYARPQVVPNSGGLGSNFTSAGGLSLPTVRSPSPYIQSYEGYRGNSSQPNPLHLNAPSANQTTGAVAAPEIDPHAPAASSAGPQRTRRTKKKLLQLTAKERAASKKEDGQPTGGLTSEVALSQVYKITKDNLKYSPLRGSKTGEGTRGPRSQEEYLKGLVRAILPAERVPPLPSGEQIEIFESDTSVDVYSRFAKELEGRLAVINQQSSLRGPLYPRAKLKVTGEQDGCRMRKNEAEKTRRERERVQLESVSRLFKAMHREQWSRQDLLGLGILFILYGPEIFPTGFIEVLPTTSGS